MMEMYNSLPVVGIISIDRVVVIKIAQIWCEWGNIIARLRHFPVWRDGSVKMTKAVHQPAQAKVFWNVSNGDGQHLEPAYTINCDPFKLLT